MFLYKTSACFYSEHPDVLIINITRHRADALNNLLLYMYFSYCYLIEY